jgi:hypothetical protein
MSSLSVSELQCNPRTTPQQRDDGRSIRQDRQSSIVAFEGFGQRLGDAIGFRRTDRGEAKLQTKGRSCVEHVLGDI